MAPILFAAGRLKTLTSAAQSCCTHLYLHPNRAPDAIPHAKYQQYSQKYNKRLLHIFCIGDMIICWQWLLSNNYFLTTLRHQSLMGLSCPLP